MFTSLVLTGQQSISHTHRARVSASARVRSTGLSLVVLHKLINHPPPDSFGKGNLGVESGPVVWGVGKMKMGKLSSLLRRWHASFCTACPDLMHAHHTTLRIVGTIASVLSLVLLEVCSHLLRALITPHIVCHRKQVKTKFIRTNDVFELQPAVYHDSQPLQGDQV